MVNRWRHFWFGCLTELALLGLAWLLSRIFGWSLLNHIKWNGFDFGLGLAAVAPIAASFSWMLKSTSPSPAVIRQFLEHVVRPIFGAWSISQLAIISIFAGICEEVLFRGVIQGGLTRVVGTAGAIVVSSIAFGLAHPINRPYVVAATAIGVYFGVLFAVTGNLLTPIVTHAVYDFCALIYFLRIYKGDPR